MVDNTSRPLARLFINVDLPSLGSELALSTEQSHYIRDVLRLKSGDTLTLLQNHSGWEVTSKICRIRPSVTVELLSKQQAPIFESKVSTLILASSKGEKMELVCQKACELGVRNITIWNAERTVKRININEKEKRSSRLTKIIEGAALQSNRRSIPNLYFAKNLIDALSMSEEKGSKSLSNIFCSLSPNSLELKTLMPDSEEFQILIGPEGGLTESEEQILITNGFKAVTLGPLVLRAETAAIAAISSINALFGFRKE